MSIEELKKATRSEAADYYRPGKLYLYAADGEYYVYLSPVTPEEIAHFESFSGKKLSVPLESLGTFLPDVAADGNELTLI